MSGPNLALGLPTPLPEALRSNAAVGLAASTFSHWTSHHLLWQWTHWLPVFSFPHWHRHGPHEAFGVAWPHPQLSRCFLVVFHGLLV